MKVMRWEKILSAYCLVLMQGGIIIFGYRPSPKQSGYDLGKRENFLSSLSDDNAGYVWNDTAHNANKEKWFRPSDVLLEPMEP